MVTSTLLTAGAQYDLIYTLGEKLISNGTITISASGSLNINNITMADRIHEIINQIDKFTLRHTSCLFEVQPVILQNQLNLPLIFRATCSKIGEIHTHDINDIMSSWIECIIVKNNYTLEITTPIQPIEMLIVDSGTINFDNQYITTKLSKFIIRNGDVHITGRELPISQITLYENAVLELVHNDKTYQCNTTKLSIAELPLKICNIYKMLDLATVISQIFGSEDSVEQELAIDYNKIGALRFYQKLNKTWFKNCMKTFGVQCNISKLDNFIAKNFLELSGVCKNLTEDSSLAPYNDYLDIIFARVQLPTVDTTGVTLTDVMLEYVGEASFLAIENIN